MTHRIIQICLLKPPTPFALTVDLTPLYAICHYAVGLAVLGGGCAGFKYDWQLIKTKEEVSKDDAMVEWEGGKFVVDEISLLYVSGTTIDWKEELFGSQFTVENPNSTSGCGCGESFSM